MITTLLYPIGLVASVLALTLWFYFQRKPAVGGFLRAVFFLFFILYFVAALLNGLSAATMARDLGIMAVVPALMSLLRGKSALFLALLAGVGIGMAWWASRTLAQLQPREEGEWELLIDLKDPGQINELNRLARRYGLLFEPAFVPAHPEWTDLDDYFLVEIAERSESKQEKIMSSLMATGLLDWVEENDRVSADPLPAQGQRRGRAISGINDPDLVKLWGLEPMEGEAFYQYFRDGSLRPAKKALIAILDTGVDAGHEDLKGNYQSTRAAYDKDVAGHGTHCAGIAGAVTNNGLGIASFAPGAGFISITSIKVLSDFGSGTQASIIKGILEAADKGAAVISLSLGGRSTDPKQEAYRKAVEYANKAGAIVIVAAGNSSENARGYAPANVPGVIAVSALDTLLGKASFSNSVGDLSMGIAAPGVQIYSTIPGNKYTSFNGTSMATPYVSGLVGVLKSLKPELTTGEVYRLLKDTGKQVPGGRDTGPLIQPARALGTLVWNDLGLH